MSDDLISRQAAIDALLHNQEVYSHHFGNDPIDKYTIAIIDCDAQTIAQLPSAQQWIPVGERLPEDLEEVLTSDSVFGITFDSIHNGKWRKQPVAWMPLPPPYKEDKDDGEIAGDCCNLRGLQDG